MKTKFVVLGVILAGLLTVLLWRNPLPRSGGPSMQAKPTGGAGKPGTLPTTVETKTPTLRISAAAAAFLNSTNQSYQTRVTALSQIGRNLGRGDCAALYEFLKEPMSPPEVNSAAALKDQVLQLLRGQAELAAPWHRMLIDLYRNQSQHPVTRDYALQHAATWYESLGSDEESRFARSEIAQVMWDALTENPKTTMPGTALLALARFLELGGINERPKVQEAALTLASGSSGGAAAQVSALQVCARLEVRGALPLIRTLTAESESFPVRLSAIAALGALGEAGDLPTLQRISEGTGAKQMTPAVERATQVLRKRIQNKEI